VREEDTAPKQPPENWVFFDIQGRRAGRVILAKKRGIIDLKEKKLRVWGRQEAFYLLLFCSTKSGGEMASEVAAEKGLGPAFIEHTT